MVQAKRGPRRPRLWRGRGRGRNSKQKFKHSWLGGIIPVSNLRRPRPPPASGGEGSGGPGEKKSLTSKGKAFRFPGLTLALDLP